MALITCPECGGTVSSESSTCPHCGYPMKKPKQTIEPAVGKEFPVKKLMNVHKKRWIWILVCAVLVSICWMILAITENNYVTDICRNTYPVVKIGTQYWMAENLRCNKYDTESEAYNASWLKNNTIPTISKSEEWSNTPYYTDASNKSKWNKDYDYSDNLTDAQITKLGYLYNWAAAVGVEDGDKYGTPPFTGNRQGICPNGWHVPSNTEWEVLYDFIYRTMGLNSNQVGKYLKTVSGWYSVKSTCKPGLDTYGFSALPAGYANGGSAGGVGGVANFWTATRCDDGYYMRYFNKNLYYDSDHIDTDNYTNDSMQSVRCVKD